MLPAFRRIVTGHDSNGTACVKSQDEIVPEVIPSGDAAFALAWTTSTFPVDHANDQDGAPSGEGLTQAGGTLVRYVDMLPGKSSPMHRTNSLDYGIILTGRLELHLEDGSITPLAPGDIVVQRGTNHKWVNPDPDTICRVAFILIDAKPAVVNGQELPEIHI